MDYCECITNSALGRSLLNFIREHTRQYCSGDECPLDGTPGNGRGAQNGTSNQTMVLGAMMLLLLLSIFMSLRTDKNRRQRLEDVTQEKIRANASNNDRDDPPPPAVN